MSTKEVSRVNVATDPCWSLAEWKVFVDGLIKGYGENTFMVTSTWFGEVVLLVEEGKIVKTEEKRSITRYIIADIKDSNPYGYACKSPLDGWVFTIIRVQATRFATVEDAIKCLMDNYDSNNPCLTVIEDQSGARVYPALKRK